MERLHFALLEAQKIVPAKNIFFKYCSLPNTVISPTRLRERPWLKEAFSSAMRSTSFPSVRSVLPLLFSLFLWFDESFFSHFQLGHEQCHYFRSSFSPSFYFSLQSFSLSFCNCQPRISLLQERRTRSPNLRFSKFWPRNKKLPTTVKDCRTERTGFAKTQFERLKLNNEMEDKKTSCQHARIDAVFLRIKTFIRKNDRRRFDFG